MTFSIGVLTFEKLPESVDEMVSLADELMYSAKQKGKNTLERRTVRA